MTDGRDCFCIDMRRIIRADLLLLSFFRTRRFFHSFPVSVIMSGCRKGTFFNMRTVMCTYSSFQTFFRTCGCADGFPLAVVMTNGRNDPCILVDFCLWLGRLFFLYCIILYSCLVLPRRAISFSQKPKLF